MPPVTLPNGADGASDESINLPLFDISQETPELGREIVQSAAKWGFLWIAGSPAPSNGGPENGDPENVGDSARTYDLDGETVDNIFSISRTFFKSAPASEKDECAIKHNRGFVALVNGGSPSPRHSKPTTQPSATSTPDVAA
ncbi:hypothetical protein O988_09563 [Pseudogymnoascus sp. VKM F-3808]|nr:hypothetical protein O988_09563 [Pseudogymnoascus sp. VKM F-3808]